MTRLPLERLDEIRSEYTTHDGLLGVVLGLRSFLTEFEDLVTRSSTTDACNPDPADPLLLAGLGVISLKRTFDRWLDEAAEPSPVVKPEEDQLIPNLRELLR